MKKLLVPVDFKEVSYNAIYMALDICSKNGGTVMLLHMLSLNENNLIHQDSIGIPEDIFLIESAKKQFDSLIGNLKIPKNVTISSIIKKEKDMSHLGELAKDFGADLIVMGTEGAHGWKTSYKSTNTQKVVRNTETPILCVKSQQHILVDEIVFVSDFDEEGINGFKKLGKVVEKMGLNVIPLYVITPETFKTTDAIMEDFYYFKHIGSYDLNIEWKNLQIEVAHSIEGGIINYTRRNKSALVCLSTHGFKGVKHLLQGSITESIVNHIETPVLTIKM